jgi:hypothetical protein
MHPMSTRSFDVVKTFGEVSMRRSRKISSQTQAGWIQYPKPVINEKQTNNRSNHIMIKWKSSLKLMKEKWMGKNEEQENTYKKGFKLVRILVKWLNSPFHIGSSFWDQLVIY